MRLAVDAHSGHHAARHLRAHALTSPDRPALVYPVRDTTPPRFDELAYAELDRRTDQLAHGLSELGLRRGMKTVLMLRPTEELFIVLLALFKIGAVPVVVDPGMGLSRMLHCYGTVGAEAFIGLPVAHALRILRPGFFSSIRINVSDGWFGGRRLGGLYLTDRGPFELPEVGAQDLLMINFTTGSTGPAKGVEYTHGMIDSLSRAMRAVFPMADGEVGLITLPLFAVVDLFLGCTAVLAPMDPTRPADVDPEAILQTIERFGVGHMFASPALLKRIAPEVGARRAQLRSLRTVVCGGAAASLDLLRSIADALPPTAALHTTYGATEALPISTIAVDELEAGCLEQTRAGRGVCVGRPVEGLDLRLIELDDADIPEWSDSLRVPTGQIGEITLCGPTVSRRYQNAEAANRAHKIRAGDAVFHRTGDVGWLDGGGRLWLCGRKVQIVWTAGGPLFTLQWEAVFNAHPAVARSALVGVGPKGSQIPVICVELAPQRVLDETLRGELLEVGRAHGFSPAHLIAHPSFPVDIRHNAKIGREALAVWAGARLDLIRVRGAEVWLLAIPLAGWLYLLLGLLWPLPNVAAVALWWVVLFLHAVVHPLQILIGLPVARRVGHSTAHIVVMTTIFGATYWRPLRRVNAEELRVPPTRSPPRHRRSW